MKHPDTAFEWVARLGYASRGLTYFILGGLAVFSGGFGSGAENSQDALSTLLTQPFGRILLAVAALGFFGFAAWRVAQGLFNADNLEPGLKTGFRRAGKALSAVAYISLGAAAAGMALGWNQGGSEGSEEGWTAKLMSLPFGPYLVGAVGLIIIGAGIGQIWKAFSGKYREPLDILPRLEKVLIPICTYGIAARGVVFCILGGFLVYAGITIDPDEAGSMGDALDWVRSLPFGGALFLITAIGLVAFAASCVVFGLYRRVDAPGADEMGDHARSMARKAAAHVR